MHSKTIIFSFIIVAAACISAALSPQDQLPLIRPGSHGEHLGQKRPNVLFILTDDQDVHLNSLNYMPQVRKHLLDKGTSFNKHYCTTAVCCPSRVTLWTGKAAHNTNITDVNPPYGGYPKFVAQGFHEKYLPVWLQDAGYNTYYTGKLFNVHTVTNYNSPYPPGFTGTEFLLDPYTYDYLNSSFQHNRDPPRSYEGQYVTDVLTKKAYSLLQEAVDSSNEKPFFLTVAPSAPHANIVMKGTVLDPDHVFEFGAPVSAERHQDLFPDEVVPRTENFNPDFPSGANWVLKLGKQNETNVEYNDHFFRQRLRALQAIDELVDGLVSRLQDYGILDNTYIVYSSDNGFHIGQHRLQPGKSCGYEEDVNIPLIIRGPGVAANYSTDIVTTHTDLAPTFFSMLNLPLRDDFDGKAIPVTKTEIQTQQNQREHANVEYWGFAGGEGKFDRELHENNTYKAIRLVGSGYDLYYSIWCNNEHELYDMKADPGQLRNLLIPENPGLAAVDTRATWTGGQIVQKVVARLDALLFVLKSCSGSVCRKPWEQLHPTGDVKTLEDALAPEFDEFYESDQTRVHYDLCSNGYLVEAEGPMWETHGQQYRRGGLEWHHWA